MSRGGMLVRGMFAVVFVAGSLAASAAYCKDTVVGFVQVNERNSWRLADTQSVKDSVEKAGYKLLFKEAADAAANQEDQIRELVMSGVDVLAFAPSKVEGWDAILKEVKDAGIPVVVLDRAVNVADQDLFVTHIGSDMKAEGVRAGKWLLNYLKQQGKTGEVKIAVLEGVSGSTPAVYRDKGFRETIAADANLKIVETAPADFNFAKGKEVMADFMKKEAGKIDVVFAHNDDMALGAIEAIQEAGKVPGKDIIIVGVDATKKGFEAIIAGKMNATIECSPLLGPQLVDAVKDILAGKKLEKNILTNEKDYDVTNAAAEVANRVY